MNIDRLLAFTRQPELLAADESQDLETLLQDYPYFSAAQLLLTVKYKQQNSSRFNRQLQRAAAHLPDKNVLAAALDESLAQLQQLETIATAVSGEMAAMEAPVFAEHEPQAEVADEAVLLRSEQQLPLQENVAAEPIEEQDVASPEIATLSQAEEEVHTTAAESTPAITDIASAEKPVEEQADNAVSENDNVAEVEEAAAEMPSILEEVTAELTPEVGVPEAFSEEIEELEIAFPVEEHPEQFLTQVHDRLSWFRFFAGKPLREQPEDVLEELYLEHMSGDFLQAAAATLPELKSDLKAVINHEPEVASDKNLEEEIRRLAYESISDEELPASETLAAIYESQKDYKKALRIYQKLMLKFPDRMTYFAGLIATTKEKLNN
jgi:hypothetical protein